MAVNMLTFKGGIHPDPAKSLTASVPIETIAPPEQVVIPLSMHIGAAAKPLVKKGEHVLLGQKIGEHCGLISSSIHASVSGTVTAIERRYMPAGNLIDSIVIKNDGLDTPAENTTTAPAEDLGSEEIRKLLQEKGIVGMGGATFPTHVKYMPQKSGKQIDTVILNGIECEPYITADYRVIIENAPDIIRGLKLFLKAANAQKGVIAIEDDKTEAINMWQALLRDEPTLSLAICTAKYPQGSEKQLIYAVTGRVVPVRALPGDVGVIVDNVATATNAAKAIADGLPLYERVVTVSGNAINKPGNYRTRIGTLFDHLVKEGAHGFKSDPVRILAGGPMMGIALRSLEYPVTKGCGGLLLFDKTSPLAYPCPEEMCVRCGKCVDVCPMGLQPTTIVKAVKRRAWHGAVGADIGSCVECGCCSFVCPAHIPLVQYIRMGKQFIATGGNGAHNPFYQI